MLHRAQRQAAAAASSPPHRHAILPRPRARGLPRTLVNLHEVAQDAYLSPADSLDHRTI